jgi:hypothetical protein
MKASLPRPFLCLILSEEHREINQTDKQLKKDEDGECQGFLEKYYPRYEGGDFFKNPQGLTLTNPDEELSFLSVWFISFHRSSFYFRGKVECCCENEYFFGGWAWLLQLLRAWQGLRNEALAFVPPFQVWREGSKDSVNEWNGK